MKKYVVYSKGFGYYSGKTYSCKRAFDGVEKYPIFTENIEEAKKYSSIKRAEIFIKNFQKKNPFNYEWSIQEVMLSE